MAVNLAQHWFPTIKTTLDRWREEDSRNVKTQLRQQRELDDAARQRAHAELLDALSQARAREEERHAEVMRTMQTLRDKMADLERRQNNYDAFLGGLTIRLNAIAAAGFGTDGGELYEPTFTQPGQPLLDLL